VAFIEIQQVRGATRGKRKQRTALIGLGLNRIGRVRWVPDTPEVRGMIRRVSHLVQINHDPAAPQRDQLKREYDEAQDVALMRRLAFDPNGIVLEPYSDAELKTGKTPDFKLRKDGNLCGFCEMKSPRDDYVFGPPDEKGIAVRKNIPYYRKLGSHIRQAAWQFDAVSPGHKRPNILVFVNHASDIERRDVIATVTGIPVPRGRPLELLSAKMQRQVRVAAGRIDLILWIDSAEGTCQHLTVAGAPHQAAALELLGLPQE
jgi:ribosomal protein L30